MDKGTPGAIRRIVSGTVRLLEEENGLNYVTLEVKAK